MTSPKFFIIGGIAAALIFTALVFFAPNARIKTNNSGSAGLLQAPSAAGVPANAFLPKVADSNPVKSLPASESVDTVAPLSSSESPKNSKFQAQTPLLDDIKKMFSASSVSTKPAPNEMLALPDVPESDISIDKNGVSNSLDYMEYFVTHGTEINFSNEDFQSFPKDEKKIPLSIMGFVDKVLGDNSSENNEAARASLAKYLLAKIVYLKSIKVNGPAVALSREMIAADRVSLSLVDRAFSAKKGEMPRTEFDDYYSKYKNTVTSIHSDLVAEAQSLTLGKSGNLFWRLAGVFGLGRIAFAAPLLVGGPVLVTIPCTCAPWGVEIIVGPPMKGVFYLTATFMASPLFFPYRQTQPGSFDLGLAVLPPMPCNVDPSCLVMAAPIILDGTSM